MLHELHIALVYRQLDAPNILLSTMYRNLQRFMFEAQSILGHQVLIEL